MVRPLSQHIVNVIKQHVLEKKKKKEIIVLLDYLESLEEEDA